MKKLYVRVQPKKGVTKFFRCGILFVLAWAEVEVDDATAKRLGEEQMLEVTDSKPADFEQPDQPGTEAAGVPPGTTTVLTAPEDQAVRYEAIAAAIVTLDKTDDALWTKGGIPKTEAIAVVTGWPVSAADRDAVWDKVK